MATTQDTGPCISCGQPVVKVDGLWGHVDSADDKYCDEVAKPALVGRILDELQAERIAKGER